MSKRPWWVPGWTSWTFNVLSAFMFIFQNFPSILRVPKAFGVGKERFWTFRVRVVVSLFFAQIALAVFHVYSKLRHDLVQAYYLFCLLWVRLKYLSSAALISSTDDDGSVMLMASSRCWLNPMQISFRAYSVCTSNSPRHSNANSINIRTWNNILDFDQLR